MLPDYDAEQLDRARTRVVLFGSESYVESRGRFEVWEAESTPLWNVEYSIEATNEDDQLLHGIGVDLWTSPDVAQTMDVESHSGMDIEGATHPIALTYWRRTSEDDNNDREWFIGKSGRLRIDRNSSGVVLTVESVGLVSASLDPVTLKLSPVSDDNSLLLDAIVEGEIDWRCHSDEGTSASGESANEPSTFCEQHLHDIW